MGIKIGFDAKRLFNNKSGLGNYSRTLLKGLVSLRPKDEYFLYTPKVKINPHFSKTAKVQIIVPKGLWSAAKGLWRSARISFLAKKDKIDIYHGLSHELPLGIRKSGAKSIVTIHDLIFMRYPEFYGRFDVWMHTRKVRYACQNADAVIAISQQTKQDIIDFLGIAEDKIHLIYQNINPIFASPIPNSVQRKILSELLLPKKYLLCVGNIEQRKNQLTLLKALSQTKNINLVIVGGGQGAYYESLKQYIKEAGIGDRVFFIQGASLGELTCLYKSCEFMVYPSLFEGFGLPIVEAIQSGKAVITSTGSCFSEAAGEGALYVDPKDENQLALAIEDLWSHPEKRNELARLGAQHIHKFEGGSIAQSVYDLYHSLLEKSDHQNSNPSLNDTTSLS